MIIHTFICYFIDTEAAMKVIERRENESLVIDHHIRVTILEVRDDEVSLQIESDVDPTETRIETIRLEDAHAVLA